MTLNSTLLNSTLCSFLCIYLLIVSTIQNKWYGNVKYFIPENENSPFLQNHIYLLSYKWQNRLKEISHLRVAGRHLSSLKCSDSLTGSDFWHDVSSWGHVSETPGPGGDGADAGEDQRHKGEASQGGAGWPITELQSSDWPITVRSREIRPDDTWHCKC